MDYLGFVNDLNDQFRVDCAKINSDRPWGAYFILRTKNNEELAYKVGTRRSDIANLVGPWHPLAKAYYGYDIGDTFDLADYQRGKSANERYNHIKGDVSCKTAISVEARQIILAKIESSDGNETVELTDSGYVLEDILKSRKHVEGLPDIIALLSRDQYRLITKSTAQPLIIQGQAGSGKTTVALYRVSFLMDPDSGNDPINPANILIVMFNKALQTFISGTLKPLGLENAKVSTFHSWALDQIKMAYRGNIEPCTDSFPGESIAAEIKAQLGMLRVVDAFVQRQTERLGSWIAEKLVPYGGSDSSAWLEAFKHSRQPVVRRLFTIRAQVLAKRNSSEGSERKRLEQIHLLFNQAIKRMTLYKEELLSMLSDKELIKSHLPDLNDQKLASLAEYQQSLQSKEGSERRPGPYIAFSDCALVLRLIQLKHGGFPNKDDDSLVNLYDHMVVDEAQDFGALEMRVLMDAVKTKTGVTIVGDINQKIIPKADFMGWENLSKELGIAGSEVAKLEIAHRSTKPIMDVANSIIGEAEGKGRPGPKPLLTQVENALLFEDTLLDTIVELIANNPGSHICVVCRRQKDVKSIFDKVKTTAERKLDIGSAKDLIGKLRMGHNKDFSFEEGVTITNMLQIKGLEFEAVIALDPTEANYENNDQGKKYLYTVITRAKNEVRFISHGSPTPLLQAAMDNNLLEVNKKTEIVPIVFTEDDEEPF